MRVCGAEVSKAKQFSLIFEKNNIKVMEYLLVMQITFYGEDPMNLRKMSLTKHGKLSLLEKESMERMLYFFYVEIELPNLVNSNSKK